MRGVPETGCRYAVDARAFASIPGGSPTVFVDTLRNDCHTTSSCASIFDRVAGSVGEPSGLTPTESAYLVVVGLTTIRLRLTFIMRGDG